MHNSWSGKQFYRPYCRSILTEISSSFEEKKLIFSIVLIKNIVNHYNSNLSLDLLHLSNNKCWANEFIK